MTIISDTTSVPTWADRAESDIDEGVFARTLGFSDDVKIQLVQTESDAPSIRICAGDYLDLPVDTDLTELSEAFSVAACEFTLATTAGARIIDWPWNDTVRHAIIYSAVWDGEDQGERSISYIPDESPDSYNYNPFPHELAALNPGDSLESRDGLNAGRSREHRIDTLVAVVELKMMLSDGRAVVVPFDPKVAS